MLGRIETKTDFRAVADLAEYFPISTEINIICRRRRRRRHMEMF